MLQDDGMEKCLLNFRSTKNAKYTFELYISQDSPFFHPYIIFEIGVHVVMEMSSWGWQDRKMYTGIMSCCSLPSIDIFPSPILSVAFASCSQVEMI